MVRSPFAMRYAGIGTYSSHFKNVFSFANNQATLAGLTEMQAGIHSERRLPELSIHRAIGAFPFKQGGAAVTASYAGYKNFNESQFCLAYGRALGEQVALGVQFNYNLIRIQGYGNASAISFETGSVFRLSEKIISGIHIANPFGGRFGKNGDEKLAAVYAMGWGFEVSEKLFFSAEFGKVETQPFNINLAMHYDFTTQFLIRAGIATAADHFFAGAGLRWNNFRTDASLTWHPQLGFTQSLSVIWPGGKAALSGYGSGQTPEMR